MPNDGLDGHRTTYIDPDGDERCECGKWLEPGYYELEDYQRSIQRDNNA